MIDTMSPLVTIYHKETGEARRIYRCTLTDFLDSGEWTVERPEGGVAPAPELKKALLPTAGREVNRPASNEVKADVELKSVAAEKEEKVEERPAAAKRAPRRRDPKPEEKTEE